MTQDVLEIIFNALDVVEGRLRRLFSKMTHLNPDDLNNAFAVIDFETDLTNLGYDEALKKYTSQYDVLLRKLIKQGNPDREILNILNIKNIDFEALLGKKKTYANLLEREIISGLSFGDKPSLIVERLNEIPLRDYQMNAMLGTFYSEFSRMATYKAFEGRDVRFKYIGGILKTSSDQCKWLIQNQKPEGYTREEIEKGIETPYHNKDGSVKIINWHGRHPNFNCIHEWAAISVN